MLALLFSLLSLHLFVRVGLVLWLQCGGERLELGIRQSAHWAISLALTCYF